jgi:hypothetical protein
MKLKPEKPTHANRILRMTQEFIVTQTESGVHLSKPAIDHMAARMQYKMLRALKAYIRSKNGTFLNGDTIAVTYKSTITNNVPSDRKRVTIHFVDKDA